MKFRLVFLLFIPLLFFSQKTIPLVLKKLNKNTVSYIYTKDLKSTDQYIFLDSRESKEYNVSHIKNAINIGYDHFDGKNFLRLVPNKESNLIVYCSIGVRSEDIGEKLQKLGYKNVRNLYGGIFEWKNTGNSVVNSQNVETEKVHTFDKNWSQYLKKGERVYEK